jgi:hypothetical protein
MVAQQRDQPAPAGEVDQALQHAATVRAAVDVVAQQDDRVVWARRDGIDQGGQGIRAAVDVAAFATMRPAIRTSAAELPSSLAVARR